MGFSELDRLGLEEYVVRERGDRPFWLFMHIPKTAGSSFSESMQAKVGPYKNIQVDYSDDTLSHNEKLTRSVDAFLEEHKTRGFHSASGHIPFDLVKIISNAVPNVKVVSFLRDPMSRVISDFRYQRTSQHPPYLDFISRFPTIESYIDSVESQNKIARFFAGRGQKLDVQSIIDRIDNDFSFVGTLEMYPLSYNVIFNLFGVPREFPYIHARKTPDNEQTKVSLTSDIKNRILKANALDAEIYNHVTQRLLLVRKQWSDFIKHGFPASWSNSVDVAD